MLTALNWDVHVVLPAVFLPALVVCATTDPATQHTLRWHASRLVRAAAHGTSVSHSLRDQHPDGTVWSSVQTWS